MARKLWAEGAIGDIAYYSYGGILTALDDLSAGRIGALIKLFPVVPWLVSDRDELAVVQQIPTMKGSASRSQNLTPGYARRSTRAWQGSRGLTPDIVQSLAGRDERIDSYFDFISAKREAGARCREEGREGSGGARLDDDRIVSSGWARAHTPNRRSLHSPNGRCVRGGFVI